MLPATTLALPGMRQVRRSKSSSMPSIVTPARSHFRSDRDDAVKLVERVLNAAGDYAGTSRDAASEEIEELVDAVNCHARTLALLAPSLRERGVKSTRESLVELMTEMRGSRETSVFASVELSLRRMSQTNQDRVRVL